MAMRALLLILLLLGAGRAWAQGENNNWAFGFLQGLTFASGVPVYLRTNMTSTTTPGVAPNGFGSYSTISDAQGRLLFYTDGSTVWDSQHRPMTNACGTCDGAIAQLNTGRNAWRSTLIVKRPGSTSLYYIFTADSQQNLFNGGLSYTQVDMTLRGGLGGVTALRNVRLPTPTLTSKISEGIAGIQHTNRKDVWVIVHGLTDGAFYSFLVTAAGISSTPVASRVGNATNVFSAMKFSPDGKRLARCGKNSISVPVELFDFDGATGLLANQQVLEPAGSAITHDIEFSPDATKLYQVQSIGGVALGTYQGALYQYDLLAGSLAATRSSKLLVTISPAPNQVAWSCMQTGPDGRIYLPINPEMSIIDRPNRRGTASGFRYVGMPNFGDATHIGVDTWELQNIVRPQPPALDYMAEPVCAGGTIMLAPYQVPTGTGPLTWTFYDPSTGRTDSVQGPGVTRTYPAAGVYAVTLSTTSQGQYYRFRRSVVVSPLPSVALPDTLWLCQNEALLGVPTPPGTTVRWSNGSTASQLAVSSPGTYTVEVTNYQGCVSTATTVAVDCRIPNIITPNGDAANETFRLAGMKAKHWSLDIYNRWGRLVHQQASYDNSWAAPQQPAGTFYYRLYNAQTGQQLKGWVEVVR